MTEPVVIALISSGASIAVGVVGTLGYQKFRNGNGNGNGHSVVETVIC